MLLAIAIAGLFLLPDPWRFIVVGVVAVIEVVEVWFWITFLRRYRITTGVEGMTGEMGEVIETCDPKGRVRFRGEIWNARSSEPAAPGASVRVAEVDGLTLVVEPEGSGGVAGTAEGAPGNGKGPR